MWGSVGGLESTASQRFSHSLLDQLFEIPLSADRGAQYAKQLHLDLSTLTPYVSGPNSVKVATPLSELESQDIKVNKAYLVSCINSRASDLAAAAKVFKEAAGKNSGQIPKIADGVKFYVAAASIPEQQTAEEAGDWQALIAAGARPLPAGCGPCIGLPDTIVGMLNTDRSVFCDADNINTDGIYPGKFTYQDDVPIEDG
jgi:homoaconitate hydratase